MTAPALPTRHRPRGFTLVEVLVSLFIMALMAGLSWQALDGVLRSREAGRVAVDRSLRFVTLLAQWETDLQAVQAGTGVPPLAFDGRTLRLVRRVDDGVQLVAWSLTGSTWQRWTSAPLTREADLQQAYMRSLQLQGTEPDQVRLLDGVSAWQIYFYRGNAWTNAQSTGDLVAPGPSGTGGTGGTAARPAEALPSGVRLRLTVDDQTLTRDLAILPGT